MPKHSCLIFDLTLVLIGIQMMWKDMTIVRSMALQVDNGSFPLEVFKLD